MSQVTLLDGGMGQELIRRAGGVATPLWSTQALLDAPARVTDVHMDFAKAGATVATTNSYALHRDRLKGGASNHYAAEGLDLPDLEGQFGALISAALDAVQPVKDNCRIAGSIGPIGASYRADLLPSHETAVEIYAELVALLAPRVDLVLFETLPSVDAARAALEAGRRSHLPVWLSLTVDDSNGSRLRSGEPLSDALEVAEKADAVLLNCSIPEVIPEGLEVLKHCGVPFGAYANGFTQITQAFIKGETTADGLSARSDLTPDAYAAHALAWVEQGATLVGGCCEVGPDHIAEIATRLRATGHDIV